MQFYKKKEKGRSIIPEHRHVTVVLHICNGHWPSRNVAVKTGVTWGIRPKQIVVSQTEVSQRFKNFSRFAGQSSTDVAQLSYFGAVSKQTASVLVLFCFSEHLAD